MSPPYYNNTTNCTKNLASIWYYFGIDFSINLLYYYHSTKVVPNNLKKGGHENMLNVVGVQEKKGNYQGYDYHNIIIHCINDNPATQCFGQLTENFKIKFSLVKEVFGKTMSSADWQNLIGEAIKVTYNRFGNVDEVKIIKNT